LNFTLQDLIGAGYEKIETSSDEILYKEAVAFVIDNQSSSASKLRAAFDIGDHKARRLLCQMEIDGIVGPFQSGKPRAVLYQRKQ